MNRIIKDGLTTIWQKGLVHIFAGSFLTKCISFFGSIVLVRALSKLDYGVLTYLENIYGYVWILAGMGMSNSILRFVVLKEEQTQKRNYFLYAVLAGAAFNLMLILVGSGFNVVYPHKHEYRTYSWLLYVLLLSLPFQYLTDNVLVHERAMFDNRRYVLFSLLISGGILASKVVFGRLFGIKGAVFGQAGLYCVLGVLLFFSSYRRYYSHQPLQKLPVIDNYKEVNSYSLQYMITNGLWAVFMLNDTFLLGRFCSAEVLAEYRVAYTIPGSVTIIGSSIGLFVAPYFVKHELNREWIKRNYKKTFLGTALLVGAVCILIGLLAYPVVWVLYGTQYLATVPLMRVLLVAAFCNCGLRFTTANILAAMGQIRYNMIISGIGTVLQILWNLWAIPRYGVYGVAITSCIVHTLMAAALFAVFYKKYYKTTL